MRLPVMQSGASGNIACSAWAFATASPFVIKVERVPSLPAFLHSLLTGTIRPFKHLAIS